MHEVVGAPRAERRPESGQHSLRVRVADSPSDGLWGRTRQYGCAILGLKNLAVLKCLLEDLPVFEAAPDGHRVGRNFGNRGFARQGNQPVAASPGSMIQGTRPDIQSVHQAALPHPPGAVSWRPVVQKRMRDPESPSARRTWLSEPPRYRPSFSEFSAAGCHMDRQVALPCRTRRRSSALLRRSTEFPECEGALEASKLRPSPSRSGIWVLDCRLRRTARERHVFDGRWSMRWATSSATRGSSTSCPQNESPTRCG